MKVAVKLVILAGTLLTTSLFARMTWTKATDSAGWPARCDNGSAVFDNRMWVLGGLGGGYTDTFLNDVWYSSDGVNWTKATATAPWAQSRDHTSVVFDNKIWVIGGAVDADNRNDVWWTQGLTGIQGADAAGNARLSLLSLGPSPFRDKATILCEAPRGKPITVRICSSNGALVKVLAQDVLARGAERFEWNGTNQTDARVPPGLYFVRLDCAAATTTRKLTRLD